MAEAAVRFDFKSDRVLERQLHPDIIELHLENVPHGADLSGLAALPKLVRLHIRGCDPNDLPPLPTLRHLELLVVDPQAELAVVIEKYPELTHVEVTGWHLKSGALPDSIGNLAKLESLVLVSCGVSELPASLANLRELRELQLRGIPMTSLPAFVAELPKLATLRITCALADLPASLANAKALRRLDLPNALKSLPNVVSELTWLEELDLGKCGVTELAPLAPLTKLRKLSLKATAISDLSPLAQLTTLEELVLDSCAKLRDLAPLAALKRLRVLSLAKTSPTSLDVIRELPALQKLGIEYVECKRIDAIYDRELELQADDKILRQYATRVKSHGIPSISQITQSLESADVSIVEVALGQLAGWAIASSSPDDNAIATAWDSDSDQDGVLPDLERAIDRHITAVSATSLAQIFAALFNSAGDNFRVAKRIAVELAARGDITAQRAVVGAFQRANEHYDPGHRSYDGTVQDELIETVFPRFSGAALAQLLAWCSDGHLDTRYGDRMEDLFVAAFNRAGVAELPVLVERLEEYLDSIFEHDESAEQIADLNKKLDTIALPASRDAIVAMRGRFATRPPSDVPKQ